MDTLKFNVLKVGVLLCFQSIANNNQMFVQLTYSHIYSNDLKMLCPNKNLPGVFIEGFLIAKTEKEWIKQKWIMSLGRREDEYSLNGKLLREKVTHIMNYRGSKEQCFGGP